MTKYNASEREISAILSRKQDTYPSPPSHTAKSHIMTPLQQGFHTLDHGLKTHRLLWQFDTFASFGIPWREYYPALAQWLEHAAMEDLAGGDFLQQVF